jgi:amino acid transporter
MFGTEAGVDIVAKTTELGQAAGAAVSPLGDLSGLGANPAGGLALPISFALIPMMVFFNLWPNWGSTLYGEVRGASDYQRNFLGMAAAAIVTAIGALIFFALISKTIGWDFYNNANGAFWNYTWGYTTDAPAMPFWPYPALFAAFTVNSPIVQFLVILLMSLWWFGWSGTVFLSSTRVIFAAAFDRMLPEWVSKVTTKGQTPVNALLLMVVPSLIIAYLYSQNILNFQTLVLDATLVIAVTFLGSTVAAAIMPWKQKEVFDGSPIANIKMPTWLGYLIMLVYAVGAVYLIYTSATYALTVLGELSSLDTLTQIVVVVLAILTVANAAMLVWLAYTVGSKIMKGDAMPLVTLAALIFVVFLDWLLVEWFWDPHVGPFAANEYGIYVGTYGVGWGNPTSMVFMFINYALAAAIFYGFNAYRKRQGIDIDKVYKEIPVE